MQDDLKVLPGFSLAHICGAEPDRAQGLVTIAREWKSLPNACLQKLSWPETAWVLTVS